MKKICIKCGEEKDITEFYKNFGNKDCYSNICKECTLKMNKEWVAKNKERKKELSRNYYQRKKANFNANSEIITFCLGQKLNREFQIKLIEDGSSAAEKLTELVENYVK
jgi:hypothetical protein